MQFHFCLRILVKCVVIAVIIGIFGVTIFESVTRGSGRFDLNSKIKFNNPSKYNATAVIAQVEDYNSNPDMSDVKQGTNRNKGHSPIPEQSKRKSVLSSSFSPVASPYQLGGGEGYIQTHESDYMDFELLSKQRLVSDRYWELTKTEGKGHLDFPKGSLTTEPLLHSNGTWHDGSSLWSPHRQPEVDEDDRFLPQVIWQIEAANNTKINSDNVNQFKKILIYDGFTWWGHPKIPARKQIQNCLGHFNSCIVMDRTVLNVRDADAVIVVRDSFHTQVVEVPFKTLKFNFILESPFASSAVFRTSNELLASYWRGSDIFTPYNKWVYHDPGKRHKDQTQDFALGKTKMVAMFVSNCDDVNNRLGYVSRLKKYVEVDVFGDCGTLTCSKGDSVSCFNLLKEKYRFYLAFENANCRDYITEKFFGNALQNNVVPVVLGAHPDDYKALAPENSYIHVEDFDSPQELAQYLRFLSEDDEEYNKFFLWKGTGEYVSADFFCRVCAMTHYADIHKPPEGNVYAWTEKFSVTSGMCLKPGRWYWTKPNGMEME